MIDDTGGPVGTSAALPARVLAYAEIACQCAGLMVLTQVAGGKVATLAAAGAELMASLPAPTNIALLIQIGDEIDREAGRAGETAVQADFRRMLAGMAAWEAAAAAALDGAP